MFVYAWELPGSSPEFEAAVEQAPGPSVLFAAVLAESLDRRMRFGLPRAYVTVEGEIGAIRGRLDILRSIRTQAFERGRAHCRYEAYSTDNPRNRIIRGTLARLLSDPDLWVRDAAQAMDEVRKRLEFYDAAMAGVAVGPATRAMIRRGASWAQRRRGQAGAWLSSAYPRNFDANRNRAVLSASWRATKTPSSCGPFSNGLWRASWTSNSHPSVGGQHAAVASLASPRGLTYDA